MLHSGNKGKSFERTVSRLLADWTGLKMGRTPMSGAWTKEPGDIVCLEESMFPFCVECKNQELWTLDNLIQYNGLFPGWIAQMHEQTENKATQLGKLVWPMLIFTRNRKPIYIMIPRFVCISGGSLQTSHIVVKTLLGQFVVGEATDFTRNISWNKVLEYHAKLTRSRNGSQSGNTDIKDSASTVEAETI